MTAPALAMLALLPPEEGAAALFSVPKARL